MAERHPYRLLHHENREFTPGKIVCVGQNYREHIRELGSVPPAVPVIFCKPASALSPRIVLPSGQGECHFEAELSFLIRWGSLQAVALGLDLTLRDVQNALKAAGHPWERAKSFDGSALFSRFVDLPESLDGLELELRVNGQLRQRGGVREMMHSPSALLAEVQRFMTLDDDDILMTGTPSGVGALRSGDRLEGRVQDGGTSLVSQCWRVE